MAWIIKCWKKEGYNARKVISEVYASFDCSVLSLGGNVNTRKKYRSLTWDPERTGFNMYAEYRLLQLTFLALKPWLDLSNIENWLTKVSLDWLCT